MNAPGSDESLPGPGPVDPAGAARVLRAARDVLVVGHVRPDADAAGSAIALATALRRAGVPVTVSFGGPEPVPVSLGALDPDGLVVPSSEAPAAPELLVSCDVSSAQRLGDLADRLDTAGSSLAIDHHASFTGFATRHLVDPAAPATVLLIRAVLTELGAELDPVLSRALFAGLYTDTGGFRWGGSDALRLGAELVDAGAEPRGLMRELTGTRPFGWLAAQAAVLAGARLEPSAAGGAGLVWAAVDVATATRFRDQTATVVGQLLATAGDGVAALLTETDQHMWSVSLRGNGSPDLSRVATALGGGGHAAAAGFERDGTREELLALLRAELDSASG
ncbi:MULTISPECIES: DHH family phosphoesterase [Pseudonocardia]|uniref:Bifunctional oligoribonuclease and PAP phosphatase NrnA n=2 Tax=Pseudonocardia TaxID=1847 RepID=A0A1Y2N285_PSEAH|nr:MULTISPECIES: DHH family phosphoesterase [Pseudonocardia]OSY41289.1 Bifunctional oligoribonuclease and PAP phosphatase NrnA [Pseudonocardia autotrophica]TDN76745.1 phosphoesterase RecJ-like protein [Pseudonocardia autotrophica]BBG00746.1 phosphoesterase [Pseudonocardia autotrophica]GEC24288.1 phosphoesterase [Pseudonocardia saturnea]